MEGTQGQASGLGEDLETQAHPYQPCPTGKDTPVLTC